MTDICEINYIEIYFEYTSDKGIESCKYFAPTISQSRWTPFDAATFDDSYQKISAFRGSRRTHNISVANINIVMEDADEVTSQKPDSTDEIELRQEFFSGNPAVETTEGIIHLFKMNSSENLYADTVRPCMLCMLCVPAHMTTRDLISFTAPFSDRLEELKVVQDGTPNQYMVLLKFTDQSSADKFYECKNAMTYNSLDKDICQLVYVAVVESVKSTSGACFPLKDLVELPNCPVCLERMDESVEGIITILCNHSYHTSCIAKTEELICPVCRYMHTPERECEQVCSECGESRPPLWICLICGHVGCGRYNSSHAKAHFEESGHTFALQVGKDRVWDYASDNWVHRIVQNKGDGKLVQVQGQEMDCDEKVDSITMEYTYLLTSQLESQRRFFEEEMTRRESVLNQKLEVLEAKSAEQEVEIRTLSEQLKSVQSQKSLAEQRASEMSKKEKMAQKKLTDELELSEKLSSNVREWKATVEATEEKLKQEKEARKVEVAELQEQLRDVMFFLDAKEKLTNTDEVTQEELRDSSVNVPEGATGGATGGGRKGRRTKKK